MMCLLFHCIVIEESGELRQRSFILGRYPNPEIATLLIEHGAKIGHKSRSGATALHGACVQGNLGDYNWQEPEWEKIFANYY